MLTVLTVCSLPSLGGGGEAAADRGGVCDEDPQQVGDAEAGRSKLLITSRTSS